MIEFLSSWIKQVGLTIVVISILEMLLPNNRTKKYIRMVLGVYVIFNIISPIIQNKEVFNIEEFELEDYPTLQTSTVDQTSMDERIKKLYEQELQKDITKKINEKGYKVSTCKVTTKILDNKEESKIEKIKLKIEKETTNQEEQDRQEENTENKVVSKIQDIKKVITNQNTEEKKKNADTQITKTDIQNIKKILIDEYGVSEKCLEIN